MNVKKILSHFKERGINPQITVIRRGGRIIEFEYVYMGDGAQISFKTIALDGKEFVEGNQVRIIETDSDGKATRASYVTSEEFILPTFDLFVGLNLKKYPAQQLNLVK